MSHAIKGQSVDILTLGTDKPGLVAVHGIQGTRAAWLPVAAELADDCTVVLPNLRGRGRALRGNGAGDYTLGAYAADLHDVIRSTVGGESFFLAGWSMGVSVSLEYLRRPGAPRPQGLILLSGSPWLAGTRWFTGDGEQLLANVAAREFRLGLREAADHDAVAWTWAAIGGTDQRTTLRDIGLPTLVLHGSADEDSPWQHAVWLADGIAGAHLITLEGAGHSLLSRNTARVVQEIRRFVTHVSLEESPCP